MTVLQLGPYPPPHGGVQTNLVAIRDYLRAQGIPCRVVNLTRYRQRDQDDVFFPETPGQTLRLLLRLPHSILHLHVGGDLSLRLVLLGLVCTLLPRTRTFLTFHSGGYPGSPAGLATTPRRFASFVLRRFDGLIAVNQALVDFFIERVGARAERVRLIPPFALPPRESAAALPAEIREFFAAHHPVMLSMGWLEPEYDFPLQIRALGPVREKYPQAGLVILGEGRLGPELKQQIAEASYGAHVLMPGDLPHPVAISAIAEADIFLRTTLYDGDSISVREALHFGTPVIASDNGMRPAGVRLIPKENQEALVAAILAQTAAGKPPAPSAGAGQEHIQAVHDFYRERSEAAATAPTSSTLRSGLLTLIKAGIAAVLIGWLLRRGLLDFSAVGRALDQWPLLLAVIALYYVQLLLIAWRWNLLLHSQGVPFRLRDAFSLTMIGVLFNLVMPGSVGGDVMKSYYVHQRAGDRKVEALATIFLDRVIGLLALFLVAAVAALPSLFDPSSNLQLRTMALFSIAGAVGGVSVLGAAVLYSNRSPEGVPASRIGRFLVRAFGSLAQYRSQPGVLALTVGISMLSFVIAATGFYCSARASGAPDFPVRYLFLVPLGLLTTALPLSPSGIGVGQVAFAELFRLSSDGRYTFGANAFTVFQTMQFLVNLTGFVFYLVYRRPKQELESGKT